MITDHCKARHSYVRGQWVVQPQAQIRSSNVSRDPQGQIRGLNQKIIALK